MNIKNILLFIGINTLSFLHTKAQYEVIYNFNIYNSNPRASLISDETYLYGTTSEDQGSSPGSVFRVKKDGSSYQNLCSFGSYLSPTEPQGTLYLEGNFLFGTCSSTNNHPSMSGGFFKVVADGSNPNYDFAYSTESQKGSLVSDGTYLYTASESGGGWSSLYGDGKGEIERLTMSGVSPATNIYTFYEGTSEITGKSPRGNLVLIGSYLYGVAQEGGVYGKGTIYKIRTDGTNFEKLYDFKDINGSFHTEYYPGEGGLITDGLYLYGLTNMGGIDNKGVLFKIKIDGTDYQKIVDFNGSNGSFPYGRLKLVNNTLYGMTSAGGINNKGTIFKIEKSGGDLVKLHDFNNSDGQYPYGSLLHEDDYLYGMTSQGGESNKGVIFKLKICSSITNTINESSCSNYILNNQTYSQTGTYNQLLQNQDGCDSLLVLNLTINQNPEPTISKNGELLFTQTYSTYQWFFNGVSILDATQSNYLPTQSGIYSVNVTNTNGCSGSSESLYVSVSSLGVQNIHKQSFKLYPNPASSSFTLEGIPIGTIVYITDVRGKEVYREVICKGSNEIRSRNFIEGVYFVHVELNGSVKMKKLIIVKT